MKNKSAKVLSIAAALLALGSNTIFAQETKTPACKPHEFTIGAIGYANSSILYAGEKEINKNYGFSTGFSAGLTGSYAFSEVLSLAAQVNFSQLSSERKDVQPLLTGSALTASYPLYANFKKKEILDYIEVPVMLRATTKAGKHVKLYADAGPTIGFIAKAKIETSGRSMLYKDLSGSVLEGSSTNIYSFDGTQITTKEMNTVTFGLTGGVGVGYAFGKNCITIDTRYSIGLTNVRTNMAVNGKNNLQTLMAGIGYSYTLSK